MQSKTRLSSASSAASLDPTAVIVTSSPPSSSAMLFRAVSSSSTISRLFSGRSMKLESSENAAASCSSAGGRSM